ncbi:MAG TPA: phosphoribosylanthranilate isomerase [Capsulimonadaceae bacterium]|jgi:phosphoribosylanthranilate isomerase
MPLIKICGITNLKDAIAAAEQGVDAIGFICDPGSPRYVAPEAFRRIHVALPKRVKRVGVFNRADSPEWTRHSRDVLASFDRIQYGDDAVWSRIVGENWDMRRKIRSFPLSRTADLLAVAAYNGLTQSYLVNVHVTGGGSERDDEETGWNLARQVHQFGKRLYLSGGLTPANIGRAIEAVTPFAVDINVGVEAYPGFKDIAKMRDFVQTVRGLGDAPRISDD